MDIQWLTRFFMWCTILNAALLVFGFAVFALAGDFVYRMHGKWFAMSREHFNVVIYGYLGLHKILVIVFNVVPWAVLGIMGQ